jgi:hypothetical protein
MISIEHSHAEGTVVHGTARGDGTNHVIKATRDGWRFSRNIGTGAWYLPHSRDRNADTGRIERLAAALREAGYEVEVRVDDTPRATGAIEADRAERVAGRVERYAELADARHERGGARLDAVRQARERIPLGQPILSARDANYRAKLHRSEDIAHADLAVGDHWQHRAHAAQVTQRYRHNPRVTVRRIAKLEADQRDWRRRLDDVRSGGTWGEYAQGGAHADAAPDYIKRAEVEIARLDEEITHWRGELAALQAAGVWAPWGPEHFRVGDEVRIIGTWYPVLRVNKKSVTISPLVFLGERRLDEDGKDVWTDTAHYDKVYGRRRDGNVLHTPPPTQDATCTERIVVPTFNAEFVPETDGGRCPGAPVARLTVRHDGTTCGCEGLCLFEDGPGSPPIEPWTEVQLWCANHEHEYQALAHEQTLPWPPAGTYERLP